MNERHDRFYLFAYDDGTKTFDSTEIDSSMFSIDKVKITRPSRICEAPVETGVKSADHIVHDPATVAVTVSIANSESDAIVTLDICKRRGASFSVYTPDDFQKELRLQSIDAEYDPRTYDLTGAVLTFKEVLFVSSSANNGRTRTGQSDDSAQIDSGYSSPIEEGQ